MSVSTRSHTPSPSVSVSTCSHPPPPSPSVSVSTRIHKTVSTNHSLFEEKGEPEQNRTAALLLHLTAWPNRLALSFVVHRVFEPYFYHHDHFFFLSFFRLVMALILKLSSLSFSFFFFLPPPPPPPQHYHLFHHYCSSQCCYYCFMCSLLACRLAGTDCKNRQLPKILILV